MDFADAFSPDSSAMFSFGAGKSNRGGIGHNSARGSRQSIQKRRGARPRFSPIPKDTPESSHDDVNPAVHEDEPDEENKNEGDNISIHSNLDSTRVENTGDRGPHTHKNITNDLSIGTEEYRKLLDKIDKLRNLGVNKILGLPQLVVTGDQSSGKSSVLEALTGLPLPRSSGLCTRFATEISLRRSPLHKPVIITMKPSPTRGALDKIQQAKFDGFRKQIPENELTADKFLEVLNHASDIMGVPRPGQRSDTPAKGKSGFSDDLLCIELAGPHHGQFSIIDLPGLIRSVADQQRREDINLIRNLNLRYIQDDRSIILAVFAANVDVANQEVLQLAKDVDENGERTLGIITKPDRVEKGAENEVMRTAKNQSYRLTLGYFVVRNRGPTEMDSSRQDRDDAERAFFNQEKPWDTLPKERVGISTLKEFLGKLIFERFRKDLPLIQSEIEDHIQSCEESLRVLGQPRVSEKEQREYIMTTEYTAMEIIQDALQGCYVKEIFRENGYLKLRQHARSLNADMSESFIEYGNTIGFSDTLYPQDGEEGIGGRYRNGEFVETPEADNNILKWIEKEEAQSRGAELASVTNAFIHTSLFSKITENWQPIADNSFRKMRRLVKRFHETVMTVACKDEHVRQKLSEIHSPILLKILKAAKEELEEMIKAERGSVLLTENPDFLKTVEEFKEGRLTASFEPITKSSFHSPPVPNGIWNQDLRSVRDSISANLTNTKIITIHDDLRAYYRVARRRIVDGIIVQVFERKILCELQKLHNLNWASNLSKEALEELASEPALKAQEREDLTQKLEILKQALFTLE
ncbi:hypothetical protein H072_5636 [Dactylellina haptotyla CBS 200.50]|uniref:GED domain-containing protein n=1 Tax=Dactylellina haptotyla (strain CBS 200.50) TaxID=1284197 RepID=S8ABZ6_DACHA|nr:hypothetical protein H072_5636 [Dactylellina haptotyla CBS 200.50]